MDGTEAEEIEQSETSSTTAENRSASSVLCSDPDEEEERRLNAELDAERRKYDTRRAEIDALEATVEEAAARLRAAEPRVVDTLRQLWEERDEARRAESAYKRDCRVQLDALDAQIAELRQRQIDGINDESSVEDQAAAELALERENLEAELVGLADELAHLNRDVYRLERQVERQPTQVELNQYQRRFLELYDQMSGKHRETKRYYALHNTLVDVRNFVRREIDLLNNIDDSRNLALRDGYKDSFVENLQGICRSIEQNLDKALCGKRAVQEERDALADQLQLLVDKQRLYMKTVVEFQAECQRNESLRAAAAENR